VKKTKGFILNLGLCLGLAAPLLGADIKYPSKPFKDSLTVTGKPVNLYVVGRSVTVEAPVQGDCCVIGGMVSILSPVQRDVEALAGTLLLDKPVGSSARLTAGQVEINSSVGADLIALAGHLTVNHFSVIQGDAALAGKTIDLEGTIKGRAFIAGDEIILNGPIAGEVMVRYEKSLTLGPQSAFKGKLDCFGPEPPLGTTPNMVYHPVHSFSSMLSRWTTVFGLPALIKLLAWLFAAWLLTKLSPRILKTFISSQGSWLKNLLWGAGVILTGVIFLPILLLTLVGSYAALLAGAVWVTLIILARLLAVFVLARWMRRVFEKRGNIELPFSWVGGAILVLHLLGLFSGLACLVIAFLSLISLGALSRGLVQWNLDK